MRCFLDVLSTHVSQTSHAFYIFPNKQKLSIICKTFLVALAIGIITGSTTAGVIAFSFTLDYLINHPDLLNFLPVSRTSSGITCKSSPSPSPELPETPSFNKKKTYPSS